MGTKHSTAKSFVFAVNGLKTALKKEPNFRIHAVIALMATVAAVWLGFSPVEWVILLFVISFVLVAELVNTALEAIVDLVSPDIKEGAKVAKDVAAAAVFVSAVFSVVAGILLFGGKIISLLGTAGTN